jgi:signal transduction histidine kinase
MNVTTVTDAMTTADKPLTTEEMTRLFSVLSHDLKSPIFSIDGFSELLISDYSDKLDGDGRDFLSRIRSGAQQMKRVLDEMSHLVKLLARTNQPRVMSLDEIIEEVLVKYAYLIEEGKVRVQRSDSYPSVTGDPEKIREALSALVSNALMFNDRPVGERTISIDGERRGDQWALCVSDNGIGIDSRYVGQIFDLGLKLDKSKGGGPGYGLFLAKRVAESHGGEVKVESTLGQGSRFCLMIPA